MKAEWILIIALVVWAGFVLWVAEMEPARPELWNQYTMSDLRGH